MIIVVLPAYNEEQSIPRLLPKISQVMDTNHLEYRIIACNDGSTDLTGEYLTQFAQTLPLDIIHHKLNRGLGETIRDLFERAAEESGPDDIIVRMDCDDTHEPETIIRMVEKIGEGADVVIASRFQEGGGQKGVNGYRTFISAGAQLFMHILFPIKGVREYSSGFRAYRAKVVRDALELYGNQFIQLKGFGFACTLEKLVKFHIMNARFAEVGFVLRYDQKASDSKMIVSITTFGYLVMAVMYHWPWGGWRNQYRSRVRQMRGEVA